MKPSLYKRVTSEPPVFEIEEYENGLIDIRVYRKGIGANPRGALVGTVKMTREHFMEVVEKLWPGEVAHSWKADGDG